MQLNFQRLGALIRKETIQILRDRRFIFLFLGLTFIQLFLYSYSASRTVYHMPLAVVDQSRDPTSARLHPGAGQFTVFRCDHVPGDQSQAQGCD